MKDLSQSITQQGASYLVRRWPSSDWQQAWLQADTTLIFSEQALLDLIHHPELVESLDLCPYVLHSELQVLSADLREQLPASVIQIGDARWVELTLESNTYTVWDDPE